MIQRIQTLYLIIADLLIAFLLFLPVAVVSGKDGKMYDVTLMGLTSPGTEGGTQHLWPLIIFAGLVMVFLVWVIFRYGNRALQIRLSYVAVILLLSLNALIYFYVWTSQNSMGGISSLSIFFTFPLVAAVFVFMAIRGITKDEQLVKSIDRIR